MDRDLRRPQQATPEPHADGAHEAETEGGSLIELLRPLLEPEARGPTASELAYDQLASAAHAPLHKPAPAATADAASKPKAVPKPAAPKPAAAPIDPERAKHIERGKIAGWNQLAAGTSDERSTPSAIRIPGNIVKQLDKAWLDSLAGHRDQEQGGVLVKTYGGDYEIHRQDNGQSGMFEPDENDVGWTEKLVAQVHTHPYRDMKDKVPEGFATFSDGDFDSLMRSDAHMSVLRSGQYTFILTKTKQFERMVDALDNDEDQLKAVAARMTKTYDKAFDATTGKFSEKCEAGVMAVCEQFHLAYYAGQGSELTRKTKDL